MKALICPNPNSAEFKALEETLGSDLAWKSWTRNNGEYPSPLEAVFQEYLGIHPEIGINLLEIYTDNEFKKTLTSQTPVLEIIKNANDNIYTNPEFRSWLNKQSYVNNILIPDAKNVNPETVTKDKFHTAIEQKLINFLTGINFKVGIVDEQAMADIVGFENNPMAAVDILQKIMLVTKNRDISTLPRSAGYVLYSMLGKKNVISRDLWFNIHKWSGYKKLYNKYKNKYKERGSMDKEIDISLVTPAQLEKLAKNADSTVDTFNFSAHKQVIIDFLTAGIVENFGMQPYTGEKRTSVDMDKEYFAKKGFKNPYEDNWLLALWNKLYNFYLEKFRGIKKFNDVSEEDLTSMVMDIADDIYKGKYEKWTRGLVREGDTLITPKGEVLELKSYEDLKRKDSRGYEIIEKFLNEKNGVNAKLSGSASTRKYGTTYRSKNETLHDIDLPIPLTRVVLEQNYPKLVSLVNEGIYNGVFNNRKSNKKYCEKVLLPVIQEQSWYKNALDLEPTLEVFNVFIGKDHSEGESITVQARIDAEYDKNGNYIKDTGYLIDFFVRTKEGNYQEEFDNYWKTWKQIFEAKVDMGRGKDMTDLIFFDPFVEDMFKFKNKGYRYFEFANNVVAKDSLASVIYDSIMNVNNQQEKQYQEPDQAKRLENIKANYVAVEWARTLAKRLGVKVLGIPESEGVPFQEFTSKDATELLAQTDTPYNGEPAFYYKGIIYLVSDKINLDSVFHEFAHPVVKMILLENRALFESLYNKLRSTPEGQQLIEAVTTEYPNLKVNSDRFMEEVIVTALAHEAKLKAERNQPFQDINTSLENQENKSSTGFANFIKELLFNIRSFLRKLFNNKTTAGGKLKVENINVDTTLQEIADIFLGKEISIEFDKVAEDYVDFKRIEREEILKLSDKIDTNKKREVFQYVINEMHYKVGKSVKGISKYEQGIRKEIRGLFVEEGERSLLKQLQQSLTAYSTRDVREEKDRIRKDLTEDENLRDAAQALINTLATVEEVSNRVIDVLDHLSKKDTISFQDIQRANFYKNLLNQWNDMLDIGLQTMSKSGIETTNNPFFNYVGSINGKIVKAQDSILSIQKKGTIEWMMNELSVTAENINKKYDRDIKYMQAKLDKSTSEKDINYAKKRLAEIEERYQEFKLDKQKVQDGLEGKTGDLGWFNKTFEGIMSINDPALGAFGSLLKRSYAAAQSNAEVSQLAFQNKIADKLLNLGYSHNSAHKFWDDYLFLDTTFDYDKDGNILERKVWSLLQPVKDWRYIKRQKLDQFDNLDPVKDKEKIAQMSKEFYIWDKKYFHQKYKAQVYEADVIFETEPQGYNAWLDKQRILELIKRESGSDFNEMDIFESLDTINQHWKDYKQLYSMNYPDGTPKIDIPEKGIYDKTKAEILIKHRNATKDFYEYVEIDGAFQKAFNEFVQELATRGITSDTTDISKLAEYHEQVFGEKGWVTKNTRTAYKPEWIIKRVELLNKIKEITGKLNVELSDDPDFNISEAYGYIFDIIGIYKNEDGQPIASEIGEARLAKIKLFQDKIAKAQEKLAITTGLTPDEAEELAILSNKVKKGYSLGKKEQNKLDELTDKKGNSPISGTSLAILKNAFSQLAQIQFKEPTDEYITQINPYMRTIKGGFEITKENANEFLEDVDALTVILASKEKHNKIFKEWFEKNHVRKEYFDNKEQKKKHKWERLYAFSVTRPTDPAYIKTFTVKDPTTGKDVIIKGEPSSRFKYRKVKDEYRTIPVGLTTEQKSNYVGVVIDNQGNYLPKSYEDTVINPLTGQEQEIEIAPSDSPFINERYYDLKNNEKEKFDLLKDVTEQTLLQQEGSTRDAKLYLDLPRFGMDNQEAVARGAVKQKMNEAQKFLSHGIALVRGKGKTEEDNLLGDEFDEGLGNAQIDEMREESLLKYVDIDLAEEPIGRIPVHGVNKLTEDRVSKNVLYSLGRYNMSLEKQKALLEIDPLAQALKDVLSNPDNDIKDMTRASRSMAEDLGIIKYKKASKDKISKREELLNYIIDREFRGQVYSNNDGQVWLNKLSKGLMGSASFTFFALNLPSGIKNYWSMLWQNTILGIAGSVSNKEEYEGLAPNAMDSSSMMQGKIRAHHASVQWSYNIPFLNATPIKERPLDVQLIRKFDAHKGFEDKFANDTNRSFIKDLISFSWLYSPRKFMEMNGTLQLFYGMMYNQQVEITEGDQTRYIPYVDAWELNEAGDLVLKEGVSKDWDEGGKYFMAFRNRVGETNNQLNGAFAKMDQPYAQQWFSYRLWSFMRRYFIAPFMARFSKDRYNFGVANTYEGFYRVGGRSLLNIITSLGTHAKFLQAEEKIALTRILADMLLGYIVNWGLYLWFGWDDDDPEALTKLKDKYEAGDVSWAGMHLLRLALATRDENQAFINPANPVDAKVFKHYLGILNINSIALSPTVINATKFLVDLSLLGHPAGYYKQDVGEWWWQKEGRSKAWNDIFKGYFGLSGKDRNPIEGVEDIFKGQYEIGRR